MFAHETTLRIRYAETDQMGYVYYGNYAAFYEVARTEMLRSTGISYKELEEIGVMLPVTDLTCKYYQPARYDDLITIKTYIREKPTVRIKFEYEIYNEDGLLLNTGYTQLVFVDMEKNRPCRAPQIFQERMERYFGT
ncbi:acyl-CoA thioester hydrolase [Sphingobacterium allocomposti]|uniref:Acyl-CoA thioester hydrolase n=1 Tax=Sphingobacterium allocomposti TaxID=415956 RepID=A0A5S5DJS2_9SPHI|nr:thioesterase family protein [Sphingobacterium composti Yoo et al. 2007 non Ten et al. 2007]TYP96147.1 acyl-CoA thioester hydrolase [Sphingobacterium composti Yoo et al. 2007 non Ten et al. 2007]HLS94954.1 thioesterase family protein [Sphingobacterium sp.]